MPTVENAILRTVLYADVFQFALTPDELHRYLIHHSPISKEALMNTLESTRLQSLLCVSDKYISLLENTHYIERRQQREHLVQDMMADAEKYGRWLSQIPFVRMLALTGALAAENPAHAADDIDYLLVTASGRVWLTRAMAIVLVRLLRLRGIDLCPNYVLSEDRLLQQRQDLYIAREIAQMRPLFGQSLYDAMWLENQWLHQYMPNSQAHPITIRRKSGWFKKLLEVLLSGKAGDWLENLEYQRRSKRFATSARQSGSSALITRKQVKGHFQDHGSPILEQYHLRLQAYNLSNPETMIQEHEV